MSESPFFQFYPSDWLAGTRGLTAAETGVYITLVAMMYEAEGPIPRDIRRLARLCGCTPAALQKAIDGLLATGKLVEDERGFFNKRVEIEIKKRSEKRASASESAKKRWRKTVKNQQEDDANASDPQCVRNANQKPEPDKKEEPNGSSKKTGSRLPEDWRLPDEWAVWAVGHGMTEAAARREADRFRDYWVSKPGQGGVKLDWQATWRNWIRTAMQAEAAKPRTTAPRYGDERITPSGQRQVYDPACGGWQNVYA